MRDNIPVIHMRYLEIWEMRYKSSTWDILKYEKYITSTTHEISLSIRDTLQVLHTRDLKVWEILYKYSTYDILKYERDLPVPHMRYIMGKSYLTSTPHQISWSMRDILKVDEISFNIKMLNKYYK